MFCVLHVEGSVDVQALSVATDEEQGVDYRRGECELGFAKMRTFLIEYSVGIRKMKSCYPGTW